ncbi:carboxypeptidase regulatory-like domain-containing protein [Cryobacterium tagatosivorans]|uniref:carboxypeptidase regulatory-like domain-containing protein n=1 Tax=Cryobacterium tagatosivorans TaxID=1259199 RepID=UPI00141B2D8B|nr:carboxypeptidase regulatory-like domain-containing protein [Cryobacterium tagatosivorans]
MREETIGGGRTVRALRAGCLAIAVLVACAGCTAAQYTISGTVSGADGRPRADCAIVVGVITGGPVPEIALLSGSDGSYAWTLPAGEYTVTAHCPSGGSGKITVDATERNVDSADIVVEGDGTARN